MSLLDRFRTQRQDSARVAKERLQIVITHERAQRNAPTYLPALKQEILKVIQKYVQVEEDQVKVHMEHEGDYEVLELNITLPEGRANTAY